MEGVRVTCIGGSTALIEVEGWRILTDPTFDPPAGDINFGWGTGSSKLETALNQ
jgi:L-ascorbate metabolism protein UlaG (beta-lactamase superfamily)